MKFERTDFSGAHLENSLWLNCVFREVRFDKLHGRGINFAPSRLESVSFLGADLWNANWGEDGLDGLSFTDIDFVSTDLRETSYGHPLFRACRFSRCNLKRVNFRGSRFENRVFYGVLDEVIFNGRDRDPQPSVASIRNPMKDVDFSGAELKYVAFSHGIDLSSCRFPSEGYVRLSQPRKTFQRALKVVSATWSGSAKEQAETFLDLMLKGHYDEEQAFDIVRVRDFEEPPWRPEVGKALFQILVNASQTE